MDWAEGLGDLRGFLVGYEEMLRSRQQTPWDGGSQGEVHGKGYQETERVLSDSPQVTQGQLVGGSLVVDGILQLKVDRSVYKAWRWLYLYALQSKYCQIPSIFF